MPIDLPKPVADYISANARLDAEGMLEPFTSDAVILDVGKRYEGTAALRRLIEDSIIPVRAIFTPDIVRRQAGSLTAEGPVHGDFPGSPLRFTYVFTLESDAIKALEITL